MANDRFEFTESDCHCYEFNWTIPNYLAIPGGELSCTLASSDRRNLNLKLILKVTSGSSRKLRAGLSKSSSHPHDFCVLFSFQFCHFRGETFFEDSLQFIFSQREQEFFSGEVTKPANAEPQNKKYHVTVRGHIVVNLCCEIVEIGSNSAEEGIAQLQQDFKEFLQSGEVADITLKSGSEHLKAHKFVLCSRSPVFRSLLAIKPSESEQNSMRVDDINSAVLKDFLAFLYTGEVGQLPFTSTCDLYSAGSKYEVFTMQRSCRRVLIAYLSDNTVSKTLELAQKHNDHELEEAAAEFMCVNFKSVSETAEWKYLLLTNPILASLTLQKVSHYLSIFKKM